MLCCDIWLRELILGKAREIRAAALADDLDRARLLLGQIRWAFACRDRCREERGSKGLGDRPRTDKASRLPRPRLADLPPTKPSFSPGRDRKTRTQQTSWKRVKTLYRA